MKIRTHALQLFIVTGIIAVAVLTQATDIDLDDDDEFQDDDSEMIDQDMQDMTDPDMMDSELDDAAVMDDMDTSDDMSDEGEPKVTRVRVSLVVYKFIMLQYLWSTGEFTCKMFSQIMVLLV